MGVCLCVGDGVCVYVCMGVVCACGGWCVSTGWVDNVRVDRVYMCVRGGECTWSSVCLGLMCVFVCIVVV